MTRRALLGTSAGLRIEDRRAPSLLGQLFAAKASKDPVTVALEGELRPAVQAMAGGAKPAPE